MNEWNYENDQWTKLPSHLKHLPLFTRHIDITSFFIRMCWAFLLRKILFRFYVRLKVVGDYKKIYNEHPRLLVISNHSSHLDATAITASLPMAYWLCLYVAAAKDYFFGNVFFAFFSAHCLGAIPIDRKDRTGEAVQLCTSLLKGLDRIWLIIFPEGTRSQDGYIHDFKKGVSLFSKSTNTPILFLYLDGAHNLFPKGQMLPKPGKLTIHIGPVHPPSDRDEIQEAYKNWASTINPNAYKDSEGAFDQ